MATVQYVIPLHACPALNSMQDRHALNSMHAISCCVVKSSWNRLATKKNQWMVQMKGFVHSNYQTVMLLLCEWLGSIGKCTLRPRPSYAFYPMLDSASPRPALGMHYSGLGLRVHFPILPLHPHSNTTMQPERTKPSSAALIGMHYDITEKIVYSIATTAQRIIT